MENEVSVIKETTVPATSDNLIAQAIASGASVEVLERLLGLKERMDATVAKQKFNEAMAAFQAECPVIEKTKGVKTKTGATAYKYAPIESIVKQVKELIQKHGFRYSTTMELNGGNVKAICRVVHTFGHTEETPMEVPLGTKTEIMSQTQVVAAAQTFAKRYAFLNAFGIMTADEDNDAAPIEQPKEVTNKATQAQKDEIDDLATQARLTKADVAKRVRELYGISVTDINSNQAAGIIVMLKKRLQVQP